jgi:hypothetical protein
MADYLLAVEIKAGVGHIVASAGCPDGRYVISGHLDNRSISAETRILSDDGQLVIESKALMPC